MTAPTVGSSSQTDRTEAQASDRRRLLASQYNTKALSKRTRRKAPAAEPGLDAAAVLAIVGFNAELVTGDSDTILRAAPISTRGRSGCRRDDQPRPPTSSRRGPFQLGTLNRRQIRQSTRSAWALSFIAAHFVVALARGRETNPSLYALA